MNSLCFSQIYAWTLCGRFSQKNILFAHIGSPEALQFNSSQASVFKSIQPAGHIVNNRPVYMKIVVIVGIDINFDLQRSFQLAPAFLYRFMCLKLALPACKFFDRGRKPSG